LLTKSTNIPTCQISSGLYILLHKSEFLKELEFSEKISENKIYFKEDGKPPSGNKEKKN